MTDTQRFEAEWISKQHADSSGEWNPDRDEYAVSYHQTKEQATQAAISGSKAAAQCEWICVSEQEYRRHEWVDLRRWSGDWNGLCDETFAID